MDRGAWPTIVHGVTKSQTQLSMCMHTHTHTHTHTHSHIASPDASGAFETVCQPYISQLWVSQPSQTEQIPIRSFPLECLLSQKGTTIPSSMSFLGGSDRKESVCNAGDLSSILVLGRSPGEGNGKPLQSSCLENPMEEDPGSLRPWGHKESDMAE